MVRLATGARSGRARAAGGAAAGRTAAPLAARALAAPGLPLAARAWPGGRAQRAGHRRRAAVAGLFAHRDGVAPAGVVRRRGGFPNVERAAALAISGSARARIAPAHRPVAARTQYRRRAAVVTAIIGRAAGRRAGRGRRPGVERATRSTHDRVAGPRVAGSVGATLCTDARGLRLARHGPQ